MPLNKDDAVAYLNAHAFAHSLGKCAAFIRRAIEAGGLTLDPYPVDAKAYGPYLLKVGFTAAPAKNYIPTKGDVVVIQNYAGGDSPATSASWTTTRSATAKTPTASTSTT